MAKPIGMRFTIVAHRTSGGESSQFGKWIRLNRGEGRGPYVVPEFYGGTDGSLWVRGETGTRTQHCGTERAHGRAPPLARC